MAKPTGITVRIVTRAQRRARRNWTIASTCLVHHLVEFGAELSVVVGLQRAQDTLEEESSLRSLRIGRHATRARASMPTPAKGTHGRPGPVRGRAAGAVGVCAGAGAAGATTAGTPSTAAWALASCRPT